MADAKKYEFTGYFISIFEERIGIPLDEDVIAEIKANISLMEPHKKIDNKGRHSEYFSFYVKDKYITIVCDGKTHKIITCILETRHRRGV